MKESFYPSLQRLPLLQHFREVKFLTSRQVIREFPSLSRKALVLYDFLPCVIALFTELKSCL